jgi:hypothetical protein
MKSSQKTFRDPSAMKRNVLTYKSDHFLQVKHWVSEMLAHRRNKHD